MPFLLAMSLLAATFPQAVVVKPVANIFGQPNKKSPVTSQAICGSNVDVLGTRSNWLHVRTADEYTGWIAKPDARRLKPAEKPYASEGRIAEVESLFAHIYREPDLTQHVPLLTVPFETRLEVVGDPDAGGRWLRVRLPNGKMGWVQNGDITFDTKPLSIEQTIALSRRFLGLPYTWGGTSSYGYDCSGLTQMLCRKRGVLMPRDTGQQAAWQGVVAVRREDLRPGDLLFFGSAADRITHTGMYIGDGKFINATTWMHPVVQICDLSDPHWDRLLVACRRLK